MDMVPKMVLRHTDVWIGLSFQPHGICSVYKWRKLCNEGVPRTLKPLFLFLRVIDLHVLVS